MLLWFYRLPLWFVITGIICTILLWARLSAKCKTKQGYHIIFLILNACFFIFAIFLISYATIIKRPNNIQEVFFTPFLSFIEAKENPEIYRTMLMNVTLFVPLGISGAFLFPNKYTLKYKISFLIITTLICSSVIECVQYIFCIGVSQTDDVICNVFGAFLGSLALYAEKHYVASYLKSLEFK